MAMASATKATKDKSAKQTVTKKSKATEVVAKATAAANASKAKSPQQTPAKKSQSKEASVKKTPATKAPGKKSQSKEASVTKTPATKAPGKKIPVKPTQAKKPVVTNPIPDPEPGIWTATTSRSFYNHVNALRKRLGDRESPKIPENYRANSLRHDENAEEYTLSYEEELHLADHFAFLAHADEGARYVSAAAIEEWSNPPSFTVRLASNHTPELYVKEGFKNILELVRDHALEGT